MEPWALGLFLRPRQRHGKFPFLFIRLEQNECIMRGVRGNGIPGTCSAGCIKGQLDPLSGVCVTVIIFGLFFHLLASQRGSRMGFKGNRAVESGWRIYFERGGRIEAESCICITAFPYHSYDAPSLLLVESLATMQTCRIYVP